ncbi:hypothetical protein PVNG_02360 [Plasmodium vivax North Korean]|uniref:Uncharacterized protein n=1 Tax=Plasmodium vivax North Korean TaxID=1035514 RepID=A0A0J9TN88_PLAVI|nr:hypothetical protein PVNG_02360 [Plasmodium vivax North Korean]
MTGEEGVSSFVDPASYIEESYASGITDEFICPSASYEYLKSSFKLKSGDKIVFLNFRPDRAKQISHLLVDSAGLYDYCSPVTPKDLSLYSMMDYEENTLGQVISNYGKAQLRVAESEKYPHVTYFFDGGVERYLSNSMKIIVPSPKVGTYDKAPQMSIFKVLEEINNSLESQDFSLVVVNLANPDMVGHSGNFEATVQACEAVDKVLGEIYKTCNSKGYTLFVMADHGNADIMKDKFGNPHTAHTTSPVPLIVCNEKINLRSGGKLGDVSPTILDILGLPIPCEMTVSTVHNSAPKGSISKLVIVTGDPLRCRRFAETYLKSSKLLSEVRGICCYTGLYKGAHVTLMAHGMGMGSMGIYTYELFSPEIYDAEFVIRLGSCGGMNEKVNLNDLVLVDTICTNSNYGELMGVLEREDIRVDGQISEMIGGIARRLGIDLKLVRNFSCDNFYSRYSLSQLADQTGCDTVEMESYALAVNAHYHRKK